MTFAEGLVVVGGLAIGYALVSIFLKRTDRDVSKSGTTWSTSTDNSEAGSEMPPRPASTACWHEILEVSPQASMDIIVAAYRLKITQYHPDKVMTLGPELRELAEAKSRAINQAYREAKALRD